MTPEFNMAVESKTQKSIFCLILLENSFKFKKEKKDQPNQNL